MMTGNTNSMSGQTSDFIQWFHDKAVNKFMRDEQEFDNNIWKLAIDYDKVWKRIKNERNGNS